MYTGVCLAAGKNKEYTYLYLERITCNLMQQVLYSQYLVNQLTSLSRTLCIAVSANCLLSSNFSTATWTSASVTAPPVQQKTNNRLITKTYHKVQMHTYIYTCIQNLTNIHTAYIHAYGEYPFMHRHQGPKLPQPHFSRTLVTGQNTFLVQKKSRSYDYNYSTCNRGTSGLVLHTAYHLS